MTGKKVTTRAPSGASNEPLTLADVQERVVLARRLVALSLDFDSKARTNAELAQACLAELDARIAHAAKIGGAE